MITFNDGDHKFWNLYIDGKKVRKINRLDSLRNFELSDLSGYHIIEWRYENIYLFIFKMISYVSLFVLSAFVGSRLWAMYPTRV